MKKLDIIVGCERFGIVRDALIKRGHNALSCDLEKTEKKGPHFEGDLEICLMCHKFDAGIFFPPCTFLSSSGLHWNKRRPGRAEETEKGLQFVALLLNLPFNKLALENPIGCISTRIAIVNGRYVVMPLGSKDLFPRLTPQIIQPDQFGEDASKATCLYLKGLKELQPTKMIKPRIVKEGPYKGKKRWSNQTDSGQNILGPSEERAALRGKTYEGIAKAMAEQWF